MQTIPPRISANGSEKKAAFAPNSGGSSTVAARNSALRSIESGTATLAIPSAVSPSTKVYWNARINTPAVKIRMPHADSSIYCGSCVKMRTKICGTNWEEQEHRAVEDEAEQQDAAEPGLDAVGPLCPVVEAEHRLGSDRDAAQRQGNHLHIALHDGGAGDIEVPPAAGRRTAAACC